MRGTTSGERDLASLLHSLNPQLDESRYVYATIPVVGRMPAGIEPLFTFREAEGLTLVVEESKARSTGLAVTYPCRRIVLAVHSSLEAVGLLAAVTDRLARAGISVNAVSAFYHDHLFVPAERAEEALDVLRSLSRE